MEIFPEPKKEINLEDSYVLRRKQMRRVRLKTITYLFDHTSIKLHGYFRGEGFHIRCPLGSHPPDKYLEWFVDGIVPCRFEFGDRSVNALCVLISKR